MGKVWRVWNMCVCVCAGVGRGALPAEDLIFGDGGIDSALPKFPRGLDKVLRCVGPRRNNSNLE